MFSISVFILPKCQLPVETVIGKILQYVDKNISDSELETKFGNLKQCGCKLYFDRYDDRIVIIVYNYMEMLTNLVSDPDPYPVIERNDKFRNYNATRDIYTLRELDMEKLIKHKFKVCQHVLLRKTLNYSQCLVQEAFDKKFKEVTNTTEHNSNIIMNTIFNDKNPLKFYIAGGAIASVINKNYSCNDYDIFIVGPEMSEEQYCECLVSKLRNILCRYREKNIIINNIDILKGLIIIKIKDGYELEEIQIILKKYPSISALLHSFDIGASCMLYDGKDTYLTSMAIYSLVNSLNIVIPKYSSTSYVYRLYKYMNRGYNIYCPEFNPQKHIDRKITFMGIYLHIGDNFGNKHNEYTMYSTYRTISNPNDYYVETENFTNTEYLPSRNKYTLVNYMHSLHSDYNPAIRTTINPTLEECIELISKAINKPKIQDIFQLSKIVETFLKETLFNMDVRLYKRAFQLSDNDAILLAKLSKENKFQECIIMLKPYILSLKQKFNTKKDNTTEYLIFFNPEDKVSNNLFSSTNNKTPTTYEKLYNISKFIEQSNNNVKFNNVIMDLCNKI